MTTSKENSENATVQKAETSQSQNTTANPTSGPQVTKTFTSITEASKVEPKKDTTESKSEATTINSDKTIRSTDIPTKTNAITQQTTPTPHNESDAEKALKLELAALKRQLALSKSKAISKKSHKYKPKKKLSLSAPDSDDSSSDECKTTDTEGANEENITKKKRVKSDEKGNGKKDDSSSDSDSSSSSSSDEIDVKKTKKISSFAKNKKLRTTKKKGTGSSSSDDSSIFCADDSYSDSANKNKNRQIENQLEILKQIQESLKNLEVNKKSDPPASTATKSESKTTEANESLSDHGSGRTRHLNRVMGPSLPIDDFGLGSAGLNHNKEEEKPLKQGTKVGYSRVDQIWDRQRHTFRLRNTAEKDDGSFYDQFSFVIRRKFNWEGQYESTLYDVNSKALKRALKQVLAGVDGISLVEEKPALNPNTLFLFLEDIRKFYKKLKKEKPTKNKKYNGKQTKKVQKAEEKRQSMLKHLEVAIEVLDKEHEDTKRSLYPLLKAGLITFDLVWALFKPGSIAYTTTYGVIDQPRAFRVGSVDQYRNDSTGRVWWSISGKYLEYDGKKFGLGKVIGEVDSFRGAQKINSLACYPLSHHKTANAMRAELIKRGKKFVALAGVHYKAHHGLAYVKKKRTILKINVDSRIMIDPASFRRILPNYNISDVKPGILDDEEDDEEDDTVRSDHSDEDSSSEDEQGSDSDLEDVGDPGNEKLYKWMTFNGKKIIVTADKDRVEIVGEKLADVTTKEDGLTTTTPTFSEDEYLIASPVVLGFALHEKLWLEFTVSGVEEIAWNEDAYENLVLPAGHKDIVRSLVESHNHDGAKNIDDIVQGKGKGLVAVLHGPPGTGKTLTAEGISDFLKCPLYMVSTGELGTTPVDLERELQKILDIAHAWGAILLLDEADVFLEERSVRDVTRNALVSIFLRLLEYFQGILFLTTNRVETFDAAFQSRIHLALKYGELTHKAKKSVFMLFVEKVRAIKGAKVAEFTKENYNALARLSLNGRQIKNTVRMAQALAVHAKEPLSMEHIQRVIDVSDEFNKDLKGGTGYDDAMRSYH